MKHSGGMECHKRFNKTIKIKVMRTFTDLLEDLQDSRIEVEEAFRKFMNDKTFDNLKFYKEAKSRRNELNAKIQSL